FDLHALPDRAAGSRRHAGLAQRGESRSDVAAGRRSESGVSRPTGQRPRRARLASSSGRELFAKWSSDKSTAAGAEGPRGTADRRRSDSWGLRPRLRPWPGPWLGHAGAAVSLDAGTGASGGCSAASLGAKASQKILGDVHSLGLRLSIRAE